METQVPAEGLYQQGGLAQVVAGQRREEVVLYLELQAPVKPVQPDRTAPVHSPPHLCTPAQASRMDSCHTHCHHLTNSLRLQMQTSVCLKGLLHTVVPLAYTSMDLKESSMQLFQNDVAKLMYGVWEASCLIKVQSCKEQLHMLVAHSPSASKQTALCFSPSGTTETGAWHTVILTSAPLHNACALRALAETGVQGSVWDCA